MLQKKLLKLLFLLVTTIVCSQSHQVMVSSNEKGMQLIVNGEKFMINGMNWDYVPVGTDVLSAAFWEKPEEHIKAGLDAEMALLKTMGINAIRQYTGVPAKWIQYIYENYGIYTMLNHPFGRYGVSLDGAWVAATDYAAPRVRKALLLEVDELANAYKNTPGLLLYLLGNENNYGLFWAGAATENLPNNGKEQKLAGEKRARPMYSLMNEAAKKIKAIDPSHPVALCNGDVLFIDIIAEECKEVDIFGTNAYRGASFQGLFQVVKEQLDMPIMLTEFGADAFHDRQKKEDQIAQAYYMLSNWKEIYENAAGLGKAENAIGGFTFQFSDGWWKHDFDYRKNTAIHDTTASWANEGYSYDFIPGKNNMNEEWFGVCAKAPTKDSGRYELHPRAAYYALKVAHQWRPYAEGLTLDFLQNYFDTIEVQEVVFKKPDNKTIALKKDSGSIQFCDLMDQYSKMEKTVLKGGEQ